MDAYVKLRERIPPPPEELCNCSSVVSVMFQPHLTANPLVCSACSGEVPPERISLQPDLAEQIGQWASFQAAFETLWLDSREYEDFARSVLEDFNSPLNQRGYSLSQKLDAHIACRYFLFQDEGRNHYVLLESCPRCQGQLEPTGNWRECRSCKIVV
jgi:hypothetical protein